VSGERVYADATTLIGLARISRLDLLSLLPTPIFVTVHVWAEVTSDPNKPGVKELQVAQSTGLVAVVAEGDPRAFLELDQGESTVLSAAAAARAAVLLDERKARALVKSNSGLRESIRQVTGIVGLLLLAKRAGVVDAIQPILDALMLEHFWLSEEFYDAILREAAER
jgi:predicted nucleic acid-binding protein